MDFGGFDLRSNGSSVRRKLAVELEKFRQKVAGVGFDTKRRGCRWLASFKFHPKPLRGGTLPSLFSILPRHVNDSNTHASGEEVCQDELEHHNLSYRLASGSQ